MRTRLPDIWCLGQMSGAIFVAITLTTRNLSRQFDRCSVANGRALPTDNSYTANHWLCGEPARASLAIFREENVMDFATERFLGKLGSPNAAIARLPGVTEVRQCGFVAEIEMGDAGNCGRGLPSSADFTAC